MTTETNENGPTGNPEMDEKIRTIASDLQVASALCEAAAKHARKGELERTESLSRKALQAIERARSLP